MLARSGGGGEVFCSPMIRSPSLNEPVSSLCTPNVFLEIFYLHNLGGSGQLETAGVDYFLPPGQLGSDIIPAG